MACTFEFQPCTVLNPSNVKVCSMNWPSGSANQGAYNYMSDNYPRNNFHVFAKKAFFYSSHQFNSKEASKLI